MYHIVDSAKSFDQATADLEAAVKRHGFGVLRPVQMLAGLSLDPAIAEVAREVEGKVLQMVMDAR